MGIAKYNIAKFKLVKGLKNENEGLTIYQIRCDNVVVRIDGFKGGRFLAK